MSLAKINSAAVLGLDCFPVEVEVDVGAGLPQFLIVGLPDTAIQESKERVRSAIKNSAQNFPMSRITVNLAPADIKKEGPAYDLPIAIATLIADRQLDKAGLEKTIFAGELSLNGELRHINGVLSIAILAKEKGYRRIFLPEINAPEAALVTGLEIYPIRSLRQLVLHLKGERPVNKFFPKSMSHVTKPKEYEYDFAYIKGQEHVKRALEIAASGGHNVLMSGPPGAGKTLLARTVPSILPSLSPTEILEVTKIYSVAGILPPDEPIMYFRPFRSPHHTASNIALVGGGAYPKPGEITLAHRGILFMDELPEFPRSVLEALRQPLEDGVVTISRAQGSLTFPAKFILIAAQNPCPCGFLSDPSRQCICTPTQILRYQKRVSGPLLDRIDLHIEVPRVKYEKLADEKVAESSAKVRTRVEKARKIQTKRFVGTKIKTNSEMNPKLIKEFCQIDKTNSDLLKAAVTQFNLSARAYHRILKLGRTIADLAGSAKIESGHIAEAIQYRPKETRY